MYWQRRTLYKANALAALTPLKLDLPTDGLLGSIVLEFGGTGVSDWGSAGGSWRIVDLISKITVQHGSTPIKSFTGLECQGISSFDQNIIPPSTYRNYGAAYRYEWMMINFGRYFKDPQFGLDLGTWNNVQLVIENTNVVASYMASLTVTVIGYFLVDAPGRPFIGYMDTQEWREWTSVQAETKYNLLPSDDVIRRILLQSIPAVDGTTHRNNDSMHHTMNNIKLTLKTGAEVVYNDDSEQLIRENLWQNYGYWIHGGALYVAATKAVPLSLGYRLTEAHGSAMPHGVAAPTTDSVLETNSSDNSQEVLTGSPTLIHDYIELGEAPFNMMQFNFDEGTDPSGWLDPNAKKSVELNISTYDDANSAGARNAILLDLFKHY
jgi:hypothetical protein